MRHRDMKTVRDECGDSVIIKPKSQKVSNPGSKDLSWLLPSSTLKFWRIL